MVEIKTSAITDHTVAIYETLEQAETAVKSLGDIGFDLKSLSVIGQNYRSEEIPIGIVSTGERIESWGGLGAFWGSVSGILIGSAMIFLPGIGHVMLAGWILGALEGAAIGGGLGVIGGALVSMGIPDDSIAEYETALKAGNYLVLAHGSFQEVQKAKRVLSRTSKIRVNSYPNPLPLAGPLK